MIELVEIEEKENAVLNADSTPMDKLLLTNRCVREWKCWTENGQFRKSLPSRH